LESAIPLEELKAMTVAEIEARLPHPRGLLVEMPSVMVDEQTAGKIRNGMQVNVPEYSAAGLVKVFDGPRELLCVAKRVAGTLVQPIVVMGSYADGGS
jgi:tRNA pseudouridine55 synthase